MLKRVIPIVKEVFIYVVLISLVITSFFIGRYSHTIAHNPNNRKISRVMKQDVILAVDEYENLILIEKSNGDYTILQDSIGKTIFNIYANRVLSQNNPK
jgi:hypothetical protein